MPLKTLQIRPRGDVWETSLQTVRGDFEPANCVPNAMGWLHYDEQITDDQAMERLAAVMVEAHQQKINDLQRSLEALKRHVGIDTTDNIMSPENTIRVPPREIGDRYISANVGLQGIEFTALEVEAYKYDVLAVWFQDELGPSQFKDLPVMFNGFPYFPKFKQN